MNETLLDVTYNEDWNDTVRDIWRRWESSTGTLRLLSMQVTVDHIARVLDGLTVVQHHLDIMLHSLVEVQRGVLHPQVVSPLNVITALMRASPYFPPDTSLPFPLSKDSVYLLYKLCEVNVYMWNDTLCYVIKLPLVNKGDYDILRLIPIPIAMGSGKFVYLDTGNDLLFFDRVSQHYFMSAGVNAV